MLCQHCKKNEAIEGKFICEQCYDLIVNELDDVF